MSTRFPLTAGQHGEAIRDLQRRLGAAGYSSPQLEPGELCAETELAIRQFQRDRGLFDTGVCDEHTWNALVEVSWTLGDRHLSLTSPNMRGDDVAALQTMLGRVGFDCGRIDGIFGPLAQRAVRAFQAETGLMPDGVCGVETVRALEVLAERTGSGPGVAMVREAQELRDTNGSISGARIVVGQFGALSSLVRTVVRDLRRMGATVMVLDEPDPLAQARAANQFAASVYLAFEATEDEFLDVHFYQVPTFESPRGRSLAELLEAQLRHVARLQGSVTGMRLPVLRETRMPAVHVVLGPVLAVTDHSDSIADATVRALDLWISGRAS